MHKQKNRSLKELCQLAEINDSVRITTYKGNVRHDDVYSKWELADSIKAQSMTKFNNLL
ncbi:MAG: hypothetical protein IJV32_07280 [Bacteroidales bacterium]|nr:hypothetical protein [Bacteroidales bacterium]